MLKLRRNYQYFLKIFRENEVVVDDEGRATREKWMKEEMSENEGYYCCCLDLQLELWKNIYPWLLSENRKIDSRSSPFNNESRYEFLESGL